MIFTLIEYFVFSHFHRERETLTLATVDTGQTHQGYNGNELGNRVWLKATRYSIDLLDIYFYTYLEHLSSPPSFALGRLLDEWRVKEVEGWWQEGRGSYKQGDQTDGGESAKVSLLLCILLKHSVGSEPVFHAEN